jgi:hypothetical protein
MRVLTTGRAALVPVLVAGALVLALPASAGTGAASVAPAPAKATTGVAAVHPAGQPAATVAPAAGVELGPAVKYVREPDGTARRVR